MAGVVWRNRTAHIIATRRQGKKRRVVGRGRGRAHK